MTTLLKNSTRIASLLLCTALACSGVQAQNTARPDLEGVWSNASLTNLTRRSGVESLVVSPEEAGVMAARVPIGGIEGGFDDGDGVNDWNDRCPRNPSEKNWISSGANDHDLALVKGEYRTSYIINPEDGQVPRLENPTTDYQRTSFGSRYLTGIGNADGPEALPLSERCILSEGKAGPAMQSGLYNNTYQFVQTTDYVMIDVEQMHDARIIPIFASAIEARANRRPEVLQQYMGDSVGWYEGDALVVETINVNPQQMQQSSTAITKNGKVTEKINNLGYKCYDTVEDSDLYSQPWTAELSFHTSDGHLYEYACHEGNYSMPGTLAGARRLEAEQK